MLTKFKSRNKLQRFFRLIYLKFFRINDTPQKIALGAGLGVFSGVLPGTGPLVALFLAFIFRVNRASALLGSLLTNTWISFLTFLLAIKAGSAILHLSWQDTRQNWAVFLKGFKWVSLFKLSALKIILPVILGYLVIAFLAGTLIYLITLFIVMSIKRRKNG
ncbi:MAG: DUF2062 domain-containing protein [Candidatus Omnitrophota bacterium]|nr:DUF2062 domain-containing protein [Candidatus Omnitrophota bacterium]